jgi:Predicted Zn-dependent peptidases
MNSQERDVLSKLAEFNGIEIYHLEANKFKTNTINIFYLDNLSEDTATLNALLPAVLRRGSQNYRDLQQLSLYLEELYGATFDCGVAKKGEIHLLHFYNEFVADKFLGGSSLFEKNFELMTEIIYNPALENGIFLEEYVEQEKKNLFERIESRLNDKQTYSVEKCFEEMCKGEPFALYEYGRSEDIGSINSKKLYDHYRTVIDTLPMKIFITGEISEQNKKLVIDYMSKLKRGQIKKLLDVDIHKDIKEVRDFEDRMNISQGKLSMGFRTNISAKDPVYSSLVVLNGILGGGIHSKLFQNVREKASLAYYAFSRLERFKGLMLISSGIEVTNKQKAFDIIMQQLQDIKNGNISDYEFDSTLKTSETGIKSLKDTQLYMVDYYLSQLITGTGDNFDTTIEKIKRVTKEDVVNASKNIELDLVYFLTSNNEGQGE